MIPGVRIDEFYYYDVFFRPVVWIQFRDMTPGVLISVNCKLWAKNIHHEEDNPRVGGVHFEIMMD